ncbi:MAG: hypothetical protein OCU22_01715 [Canidatus Methanoxibalbensis ujae]|nr:hypothetical protein [Candidatus Methanoxibalbensis ujae]
MIYDVWMGCMDVMDGFGYDWQENEVRGGYGKCRRTQPQNI